ncbi:MAG TPA: NAD(P)H-hydrate dehydratase [Bryobacteraceae bacterium]|nr:NAD(P)H-hydrate dehydratase [Bryobacteraceae bacterium]
MKVLTAAQMREVDRRTSERGVPGIVLMENAGHRVVEFLERRLAPLAAQRIAVLCGKGNNGGDGMVVARQLHTRIRPAALDVVLFADPSELKGDAATNYRMLGACGCALGSEIPAAARNATLVIDALLGTGVSGPATGRILEGIREINCGFPLAKVAAVDIPSGMPSDSGEAVGEIARADYTITFTAPKVGQALAPNCDRIGELAVCPIGSSPELYENDASIFLSLIESSMFRHLLAPRPPSGHKGTFGHVLVVAGSRGKTGAAAMSGMASLRAGAGLVTVASASSAIPIIAGHAAELMTEPLEENEAGGISRNAPIERLAEGMTVIAMGPGMGRHPDVEALVTEASEKLEQPMVIDADGLTVKIHAKGKVRVMTPHPGEMSRLTGKSIAEVQKDRVGVARAFAMAHGVALVLKGQRTVIAFPDGAVWINPTGTPALGTGGTGDILTGLIAGFLAQFPHDWQSAVAAAVYLGGLAGQLGARELGDKSLVATDLLRYLPRAMEECAGLPHGV